VPRCCAWVHMGAGRVDGVHRGAGRANRVHRAVDKADGVSKVVRECAGVPSGPLCVREHMRMCVHLLPRGTSGYRCRSSAWCASRPGQCI